MNSREGRYAVTVPERFCEFAYHVVVENLEAIVDEILYEAGTSTLVVTAFLGKADFEQALHNGLCRSKVLIDLEELDEERVYFVDF